MTKLFHIKIQVKKTKIETLFDSRLRVNLIITDLVKIVKQCKIKFVVSVYFFDEVELDVVPLDVCGVCLESPMSI